MTQEKAFIYKEVIKDIFDEINVKYENRYIEGLVLENVNVKIGTELKKIIKKECTLKISVDSIKINDILLKTKKDEYEYNKSNDSNLITFIYFEIDGINYIKLINIRERCRHCGCLIDKDNKWVCDDVDKSIYDIINCEGWIY